MIRNFFCKLKHIALILLKILSKPIYATEWYKGFFVGADGETYPDNNWYRKHEERNFDLINLGSSGGKWAFDYSEFNIKAMNWAQQPQTLLEDFNLLRNYHSILKKGGIVLVTIMPFTGLNKTTDFRDAMKYLKIDAHEPIQPVEINKAQLYTLCPILMGLPAIKAVIKHWLGEEQIASNTISKENMEKNPMSDIQLDADAKRWIDGWKKQFSIENFEAPLTDANQKGREFRIKLMRELIDFCTERTYKPVYVIPPVTKHLSQYYTPKFEETYIYDFLRAVKRDVVLLDYSKFDNLQRDEMYFNSFFLNKRGRTIFTKQVLKDIELRLHYRLNVT